MPAAQPPPHGTVARYGSRRFPCHCGLCRSANARRKRAQMQGSEAQAEHRRRAADRAGRMHQELDRLKDRACHDCGLWYPPECMDFDHRPGEKKLFSVSSGLNRSRESVLAEVSKCDLVCANCHRIRTKSRRQETVHAR